MSTAYERLASAFASEILERSLTRIIMLSMEAAKAITNRGLRSETHNYPPHISRVMVSSPLLDTGHRVIAKVLLVGDGHDDGLAQEFELHAYMEPVELRFHRPGRAALNEIAETVITVRDDTHDSISLHALLQEEAVDISRSCPIGI